MDHLYSTSFFSSKHTMDNIIRPALFEPLPPFTPTKKQNKIPRPLNSFMIFRLQSQKEIVRQCPGANHRDISKIISKWWKELSAKEKQSYKDQADRLKVEHRQMYPDYKFSPRKRTTKPRAYRKRASHEFSARDHDNKQNLYALYQSKPLTMQQDSRHSITYLVDQKEDRASPSLDQPIVVRSSPIHTTPYDTQLLCPPYYASSPASTVYPSVLSQSGSPVNSYDFNASMTTETTQKETCGNYNSYLDHSTAYPNYYSFNGDNYSLLPCYISLLPHPSSSSTPFPRYVRTNPSGNINYYSLGVSEGPQIHTPPTVLTQPFLYSL